MGVLAYQIIDLFIIKRTVVLGFFACWKYYKLYMGLGLIFACYIKV